MNWSKARVLVTGAGGFIGSTLVEHLLRQGAHVRAFVRYNSRNDIGFLAEFSSGHPGSLEVRSGDLRDASAMLSATEGVDYIFHLGALIAIPYSYVNPREVVETNVIGTVNVLEGARRSKPVRLIHTSTSEVYGTAIQVPIPETHPLQGQSPYSASKIGADKIVESYYRSFDLPAVTVRPFNTYGPRQSARAVIPTIITQALTREEIKLGSLTPTRDLTFVDDTVSGFLRAAESDKVLGREINLGSNNEISVGQLTEKILELVGRKLPIVTDSARLRPEKSEVGRLHSDNSLARELMGWTPTVDLSTGLSRTIEWIRNNLRLYRSGEYTV